MIVLPEDAISAAADAIHAHVCDPHAGHERDDDGTGDGWICLDCSTDDADVRWFRRDPDDEDDVAAATVAVTAAAQVLRNAYEQETEDDAGVLLDHLLHAIDLLAGDARYSQRRSR